MTHTSRNTGFWYRSDAGRNDGVISEADTYDSGLLVELRGDRSLWWAGVLVNNTLPSVNSRLLTLRPLWDGTTLRARRTTDKVLKLMTKSTTTSPTGSVKKEATYAKTAAHLDPASSACHT